VRVAFFGLPLAAVLLARDGHEVGFAALSRRGYPGQRRLAQLPGHTCLQPEAFGEVAFERLRASKPDLIVSWYWTKKLPARVLALAPAVGIHPSLLPRHRGPDPTFWVIDSGEEVTGVTAHTLHEEYDTGDVLASRELRVLPTWNSWQLQRALDRPGLELLRDVVRAFAAGQPPRPRPQNEALATAAPAPTEEELAIRWSWPAWRVERRVRAAAPWPGAWTDIGGHIVTLLRVRPTGDYPRVLEPGEAALRADGVAVVRTGGGGAPPSNKPEENGAVELLEGRVDDEDVGAERLASLVVASQLG
jgi:methionyl-tRNA formyltransferase